jgi:hypothetical protein
MQVSRKAGFILQETSYAFNGLPAKLVTRPGPWGNPFSIDEVAATYKLDRSAAQTKAVAMASDWFNGTLDPALSPGNPPTRETIRRELAGHNLACWCKPGTPCHADVLIDLAND